MTAPTTSSAPSEGAPGRRDRRAIVLALVVLVVVGIALVLVAAPGRRSSGPPLDPRSTDPDGARAAMELADRLGADVRLTSDLPDADTDVALLLDDLVRGDDADELLEWVEGGGVLVVADRSSDLAPTSRVVLGGVLEDTTELEPDRCDVALAGVAALGTIETPPPVAAFDLPPGAQGCYSSGDRAVLVTERRGDGTLVAFGAARAFTNAHLAQADNAGLFAALAVPFEGARLDVFVAGEDADAVRAPEDAGSLGDVVPTGAALALLQLVVAFVVYALHRGRRLGTPVPEDPPVAVAGSELVRAVGAMLEAAGARDRAAASLRRAARRRLAERFGMPASSSAPEVAAAVAARTSLAPERLHAALLDGAVADDAALQALSTELDRLVDEACRPPGAPSAGPTTDRTP
jgi:hypothetical protein